ncbi:hypothetical protein PHLCEN_2v463 [Hermanssonia centrifuga]|uniref:Uncharacterized protein n=1 Tax=Hermanssonia centrifuga TaxID=98765 RepID=A0A2R6S604_9APHY|nr:hypothetical protein PHLCEN_2v463 [Hermanssonia centrifuga]
MSSDIPEVETVVAPTIDSSESESTTAVVTSDVVTQEEGFRGKNVKLTAPAAKPPQGLQAPGTGQVKITARTDTV